MINSRGLNTFCSAARGISGTLRQPSAPLLLLPLLVAAFGAASAFAQEYDTVYQLRSDGKLLQNTCSGASCQGGQLLDKNPLTASITSGGGGLFEVLNTGVLRQFTGTPCNRRGLCLGWLEMDNNAGLKAIAAGSGLGSSNPYLFQLHVSGGVWQSTGTPCSGNSCLGWTELDNNSETAQITAAGGKLNFCFGTNCPPTPNVPPLVQSHADGSIWQYNGTPCNGGSCTGWTQIDFAHAGTQVFGFVNGQGGAGSIFQIHDGMIFKYTGQPCSGTGLNQVCPGWQWIESAFSAKQVLTAETSGRLYVLNTDGSIWELSNQSTWIERDNNSATVSIAASNNGLFKLHGDGSIWYLGTNGWVLVDNNSGATAIAASSFTVY